MTGLSTQLLDSIHNAHACVAEVGELASVLADTSPQQLELQLQAFIAEGDDQALSRLLQACAWNQVRLDPDLLCRCIGVCEEITDTAPCFALQQAEVVAPLLATAVSESLSQERQIYAATLAAELVVKFSLDPQPVRKVLWKLEQSALLPMNQLLLGRTLQLLETASGDSAAEDLYWTELKLQDILPDRYHSTIGGTYTVRRPVAKLGRNDPCHCGSGRKYKKCCLDKDQSLLSDASAYTGKTRSELKSHPGLVDDPDVILDMRGYELQKLQPATLGENQLFIAYQRTMDFGLRELAFDMLLECEKRPGERPFDRGHFEDLIEQALASGELELARRIRAHCGDEEWHRPQALQFRFDLLQYPERFEALESHCRKSVCGVEDEETRLDEPLVRLAYDFEKHCPALALVFARAAISSHPEHFMDNAILLDLIRELRIELDLEPWDDPAEVLSDWMDDRHSHEEKDQLENAAIKRLTEKLAVTRDALEENRQALGEMEQTADKLGKELEKAREKTARAGKPQNLEKPQPDQEATLQRLRSKVENLKAEIGEQQKQRTELRHKLAEERNRQPAHPPRDTPSYENTDSAETAVPDARGHPLVPDYTDEFRKSCQALTPQLAAKALLAAGRFAAQEKAIWRQTKPLQRLPDHYRIRIHRDYRLILRWLPGQTLHILDVIPRQNLETWIRQRG